jgi:hypothetical protein
VSRLVAIGARVAFVMAPFIFIALLWTVNLFMWSSTIEALSTKALDGTSILGAVGGSLVKECLVEVSHLCLEASNDLSSLGRIHSFNSSFYPGLV